jgi:hypothetical protein
MQPLYTIWTDLGGTIHILFWIATSFSLTERGGVCPKGSDFSFLYMVSTYQDPLLKIVHVTFSILV